MPRTRGPGAKSSSGVYGVAASRSSCRRSTSEQDQDPRNKRQHRSNLQWNGKRNKSCESYDDEIERQNKHPRTACR